MGLNPEALSALESLRQQLVADGHPDEREPEEPQKPKEAKKQRPKRTRKTPVKTARQTSPAEEDVEAAVESPGDSQQKPKRRVGKNGKVYPTATQKRRARRKRALEREQLESSTPSSA